MYLLLEETTICGVFSSIEKAAKAVVEAGYPDLDTLDKALAHLSEENSDYPAVIEIPLDKAVNLDR
jgi:hypothetical protein